ncbi:dTDP-4-dehydrorhamnose 3,5-epimerase [Novosphingobium sp. 11B]
MIVKTYEISGPCAFVPSRIADTRGWFAETFRHDLFARHCGDAVFVQDNESCSLAVGTVRGLHYQRPPHAQGKLVRCTAGAIMDVAVDIRAGSPTYGHWIAETLTPDNGTQLWIPPGFAHGFCTLLPDTVVAYKVTDYYCAECDLGMRWNDPALAIDWPQLANPASLSPKDRAQPLLCERPAHFFFEELAACA